MNVTATELLRQVFFVFCIFSIDSRAVKMLWKCEYCEFICKKKGYLLNITR